MTIFSKLMKNQEVITIILIVIVSLALLIPILIVSKYNVPSADDYSYGYLTYQTWNNTHNIFSLLNAVVETIVTYYFTWQGTFAAIFLFALQPSIFGLNCYWITTTILLTFLISSNIYLVKTISQKIFGYTKKSTVIILSLLPTMFAIEFVPNPRETLFWWNGAIYYTFFYSLALIALGIIIQLIKSESRKATIINNIIIVILALIIGAGNYCTALSFIIILTLLTIYCLVKKNNKKWNMLVITVVCLIALIISILAPGNAIRQSNYAQRIGAIESILTAIKTSMVYFIRWTNLPTLLMFIILIPPIYKLIVNAKYTFKYPILFTVITFGIFASQIVPPFYAMNNIGGGRTVDIFYYSYFLFVISNMFYYIGWIKSKYGDSKILENINNNFFAYILTVGILMIASVKVNNELKSTLSYVAYNHLTSGDAKQYYSEIVDRYKIYENKDVKNAVLKPLTKKPSLLCGADITKDETFWVNKGTTKFFNKESVKLEE